MRADWTITNGVWGCPHCHQYSAVVCASSDKEEDNPATDCPVCGWSHMMSQWYKRICPEGCLMIQPKGSFEKRSFNGWDKIELIGEVAL